MLMSSAGERRPCGLVERSDAEHGPQHAHASACEGELGPPVSPAFASCPWIC
jgi:hypothetical protein